MTRAQFFALAERFPEMTFAELALRIADARAEKALEKSR